MISKHAAGREKDRDYVRAAAKHGLVGKATLLERLSATPLAEEQRTRITDQIEADFSA